MQNYRQLHNNASLAENVVDEVFNKKIHFVFVVVITIAYLITAHVYTLYIAQISLDLLVILPISVNRE